MTTDQPVVEETKEKAAGETRPPNKPAYVLAAEAAEQVEDEKRANTEKAAFVAAANPHRKKDKPEDGADVYGAKPGLRTTGANPNPLDGLIDDSFVADLKGKGWIKCRDGTMVRDDGHSIHIPGKQFSIAQMEMVAQLSAEKGWTNVYVFEKNGKALHPEGTQMLSSIIAASHLPMQCCTSQKAAGTLRSHLTDAENTIRHTQQCRHEAQKAQAPATPAPGAK